MPFLTYNRNLEFLFGDLPMFMHTLDIKNKFSTKTLSNISGLDTVVAKDNKGIYFKIGESFKSKSLK